MNSNNIFSLQTLRLLVQLALMLCFSRETTCDLDPTQNWADLNFLTNTTKSIMEFVHCDANCDSSRCKSCQDHRPGSPPSDTHAYICPWKAVISVDRNRFPHRIQEVKCVDPGNLSAFLYRCEEVTYHVPVLRRNPVTRSREALYEEISTGCIVTRARVEF